MNTLVRTLSRFRQLFGVPTTCYRAPGRVNLIGEHTDYNGGFVLPVAIALSCWVAASPRGDRNIAIYSENFAGLFERSLELHALTASHTWSDYALGVAWALEAAGYRLPGANLFVHSEIPIGGGLSSSAAFEVAVASALVELAGREIPAMEMVELCQRAENDFVGARSGVMDQFTCCHGRTNCALLLDCTSLQHESVPLPADLKLVVCNTMVRHEIAGSAYNLRRLECEKGVQELSAVLPNIRTLRDVSLDKLELHRELLPELIYRRCRHVINENRRVLKAAEALRRSDVETLGNLMAESHVSLRDDYEVSCAELDLMVEIAVGQPGLRGVRMTGAGFGGCTVNLVDSQNVKAFRDTVAREYHSATGRHPDISVCDTSNGVTRVPVDKDDSVSEHPLR